jgi:DNA polymerase-1
MSDILYLIDTLSLVFQVYHAIPEMTGPKGQPTNAVFGFTRDLQMILQNNQPSHLICAMDTPGPGVRNEIYEEYKANRSAPPEDLPPQIPVIIDVIEGFGVPVIEHEGWEADDVIATLCRQAVEKGMEVRIVSSDKDLRQLLGPHVQIYNCRKGLFYDEKQLLEDWGIRPDQVIDFQALTGDKVDNVPGVPLVGPKKAGALLNDLGTLDDVLANAEKAPGKKLRENLETYADQARLSRELVTLKTDLPLTIDWESAHVTEPNRERLFELFTQLGFRRFAESMQSENFGAGSEQSQERIWDVIDTENKFSRFLAELKEQKTFCVDLETTSLDAIQADIVGWAFSWQAHTGYYLPVDAPPGQPTLNAQSVLESLRPLLEDPEITIVNQNIKYDMLVLRRAGVRLQGLGLDPMVGDYLLNAGARGHGLDKLAEKYLQHRMIPISDLIGGGKQQKKMFEVDVTKAAEYAAEDADIAWQLSQRIAEELRKEGLWELYWDLERPLISVLAEMEFTGIRVNVEELQEQSEQAGLQLSKLVTEIHDLAEHEFNIDSPKQLSKVLFEKLKLPVLKKTKTGASTAQDVLEKLAVMHPLPEKIIDHRRLSKLKNTYLDALPSMVNPQTGRIHASFNQVVAATGRLSSSAPNLQNIPIRTTAGRQVRKAFIPGVPGWKLVCADYSQVELRILAHFSGDDALKIAFQEGEDIHTSVASEIFDTEPREVDAEMRRVAKAVNFGVIYGQSPYGLSEALGITQGEAAEFIDNYFTRYAGVERYLEEILEEVERTGYACTILGRRRPITGISSTTGRQRNLPERTAINSVIQGSAADLIKQAMINVHAHLHRVKHPGKMLLQIHDELVFETPAEEAPSLIKLVREEMETALELNVPLVVDIKWGENWLETEEI